MSKSIDTAKIDKIRHKLIDMHKNDGLTQRDLERMSGNTVSAATINKVINNVGMENIAPAMWNKLAALTQSASERANWNIYETTNMKLVMSTCEAAMAERSMKLIIAETGFGKTTALDRFRRKNADSTVYVLMRPTMGVRDCMIAIAQALGLSGEGTVNSLVNQVSTRLIERGGLLILDDCGKVIKKFFRIIQQIYDSTEGSVGIVLAGVPALKIHLTKEAGRNKESYPELVSRIGWTQHLHEPSKEIVVRMCNDNGITDPRAHSYIHKIAKNYRDLRNLITAANRLNTNITPEVVMNLKVGGFYNN